MKIKILDDRLGTEFPLPAYHSEMAAGIDLRAMILSPTALYNGNIRAMIHTGFAIHIGDPDYCGLIYPRSGLAHKEGIILGNSVGVIDADYQGEILLSVWNSGRAPYLIKPGERLAQLVITRISRPVLEVVDEFEASKRKSGGFGHTGKI